MAKDNSDGLGCTGTIFVFVIIMAVFSIFGGKDKSSNKNKDESPNTYINVDTLSQEKICTAAIATVMGRDPNIIKISKTDNQITYLSYIREEDNSQWQYRCKLEGNKVIWATSSGRWRVHPDDSVVTYKETSEGLQITEDYGKGSLEVKTYPTLKISSNKNDSSIKASKPSEQKPDLSQTHQKTGATIKFQVPACISEDLLDEFTRYIIDQDAHGMTQLINNRECIVLKEGDRISVISWSFIISTIRVSGTKYFVASESIQD